jgi:putative ABC transport system permease protein
MGGRQVNRTTSSSKLEDGEGSIDWSRPALAGAVLGIPGGIALIEAVDTGDPTIAPLWQLLAVVLVTVLVVAVLTAIPARISARRPVAEVLAAERA